MTAEHREFFDAVHALCKKHHAYIEADRVSKYSDIQTVWVGFKTGLDIYRNVNFYDGFATNDKTGEQTSFWNDLIP